MLPTATRFGDLRLADPITARPGFAALEPRGATRRLKNLCVSLIP